MMKSNRFVLAVALTCFGFAFGSTATAGLLIYEPFDYTSGQSITGQANTHSAAAETWQLAGPAAALHVVGSGSLSPSAAMTSAGFPAPIGNDGNLVKSGTSSAYDRLSIPNAFNPDLTPKYGANSTLYYSLLLDVPSITGLTIAHTNLNANNDGLIAFNNSQGAQGTAPNTWTGELVIRLGSTTGTYNLGIRGSTTTNNTTYFTGDLTPGTTYFVVVEAQLGATPGTAAQDLNSLWINPSPSTFGLSEGLRPAPDGSSNGAMSATNSNNSMQSIIIGAGIATSGAAPNSTLMDEIRVGETWKDVTPLSAVPEAGAFVTFGLSGIFALAGVWVAKRHGINVLAA